MTDPSALGALGYSPRWEALLAPYAAEGLVPARVIRGDRGSVLIATADDIVHAKVSARLVKSAISGAELPAVGDWVAVRTSGEHQGSPLIDAVLQRTSAITRSDPGGTSDVQVLAANIDVVFVVHPIADLPNLRRIERELSVAWDSGAMPVVLLTKADLSEDPDAARAAVEAVALGADVLAMNALAGDGIQPILTYIAAGHTAVLVGPSGAGKSTIVNSLLGEQRQTTHAVRESDGKGMHTTVSRELIQMPGGGVLIDTPGLRAFGLTGSEEGIASVFPEIAQLAGGCRFSDCTHDSEPGCAVQAAVGSGAMPPERLASYHKLMGEARSAAGQADARLRAKKGRRSRTSS
jgi:ribosome biogenesis GTPase / thiamine phosphate phosphatase